MPRLTGAGERVLGAAARRTSGSPSPSADAGSAGVVWFHLGVQDVPSQVEQVSRLIDLGHHRDEVPGLPGVALDGGGAFRGGRRLYHRGTDEFAEAAVAGVLDRLPAPPPAATSQALEEGEALVGAPFPPVLRALYGIANGGFGPGYGLLGLRGGWTDSTGRTAVDVLAEVAEGKWPGCPEGLWPLTDWGCAIYSFVHCPTGRLFGWDPNPVPPEDEVPFFEQEYLIDTWFEAWLGATLIQPWLIHEPDTHTYRGATIEETRAAMLPPEPGAQPLASP